jgi:hypothetical protein
MRARCERTNIRPNIDGIGDDKRHDERENCPIVVFRDDGGEAFLCDRADASTRHLHPGLGVGGIARGSSSAAPVMRPGPRIRRERRKENDSRTTPPRQRCPFPVDGGMVRTVTLHPLKRG